MTSLAATTHVDCPSPSGAGQEQQRQEQHTSAAVGNHGFGATISADMPLDVMIKTLLRRLRVATERCVGQTREQLASVSFLNDSWMAGELASIFREAAPPRELGYDEELITQGVYHDAIHFVTQGYLILRKKSGPSNAFREIGRCVPGSTVGELSFLLGALPNVSVFAPSKSKIASRADASNVDHSHDRVIVHTLTHQQILGQIENNPRLMHRFFFAIAANISRHLQSTATQMKSLIHKDLETDETKNRVAVMGEDQVSASKDRMRFDQRCISFQGIITTSAVCSRPSPFPLLRFPEHTDPVLMASLPPPLPILRKCGPPTSSLPFSASRWNRNRTQILN